jgi:hypothetical protein
MGGGKGGGSSTTVQAPQLTPDQIKTIQLQNQLLGTVIPTYQNAVTGATNLYNQTAPGQLNAAQNLATTAAQAQEALGGTGESALRTGVSGLENLFDPNYEQNQVQAALMPAQAQYMQNIANQQAQFGGAGQLGSARQALAGQQLAGMNAATQAQTAAQVANQVAGQRAAAAGQLASLGQGGLGQAMGAASQQLSAAASPQQLYNQYASIIFGTPQGAYTPNYAGTQGSTTTGNSSNYNASLNLGSGLGGALAGAGMLSLFSDIRLKENIKHIKDVDGIKVYSFNYVWDETPHIGAMAQDLLESKYAHAVHLDDSGYYKVDYSKLPLLH